MTDLTLIPCSQDFENSIPSAVTVQFEIFNEFEQKVSASITIECFKNFFLFQVDSPNDPENSVFSYEFLGTIGAHTRITPNPEDGGVIGVAGVTRADARGNLTRVALNIHMEGDQISGPRRPRHRQNLAPRHLLGSVGKGDGCGCWVLPDG